MDKLESYLMGMWAWAWTRDNILYYIFDTLVEYFIKYFSIW
jgi:hypothetical protein